MPDWYQKMLNRKNDTDIKTLNTEINLIAERENELRQEIEGIITEINVDKTRLD